MPWLVYMICLTSCFLFFSVFASFFDVISCILKLSILLVLIPLYSSISFIKLGNSLTYRNPEAMHTKKIILLDIITILLSFLTDSNFVLVLSHYIATDDTRSFCYFISTFIFFLYPLQMILCKKFLQLYLIDQLPRMIHPIIEILFGNSNKSDGSIFLFDKSIFLLPN